MKRPALPYCAEFVTVLHAFILQQRDVGDLDTYVNFGVEEIAPGTVAPLMPTN